MPAYPNGKWHWDEVPVNAKEETSDLWHTVDNEGEALERFATQRRDRKAAVKLWRKIMKRHGRALLFVADKLRPFGAKMQAIGSAGKQETGRSQAFSSDKRTYFFA